jgi:integrase
MKIFSMGGAMKRYKTDYPGVFYRVGKRIGGKGSEKIYYVVFKKDGRVIEEKAGRQFADNMTPAKAAHIRGDRIEGKRRSRKDIREQKKAEAAAKVNRWTIDRLFEHYKADNPGRKDNRNDENRYKNYIKPKFKNKVPDEILQLEVDRLRINLLKKRAPATVKNILELLRRVINHGADKNLCKGIGFKIKMPTVNNTKTEDLSRTQLTRLLAAIEKDEHPLAGALMKMALFTGMRRGEMFKLRWSDINFERGFIFIKDPKGGPDQQIPLNDSARALLKALPKTGKYVFPGRGGKQRTDINKAVNAIKKEAKLPKDFRPLHGLRHTYASMLASSGNVDLYTLQKLLTHKSPQMTQRYAHLRNETLTRASNIAGEIISETIGEKDEKAQNV